MNGKAIGIKDIARLAGVSTATVSRTLSQPGMVSTSTRDAVMQAVRATGYRVNHTARNLRRQRTGSIVALVPRLANPFFSQILSGMAGVFSAAGYGLLVADTEVAPDPARQLSHYIHSGIADGLVLLDARLPRGDLCNRVAGPPVVLACEWMDDDLPSITVDNVEGAAVAVRHFWQTGHRRIGHITGPAGNVLTESRLHGVRATLATLGSALRDDWTFPGDFGLESGARAAAEWLALKDRPTAVFCSSDEMACGFIGAVQRAGLRVPDAVSVIGFDDIEVSAHLTPGLTSVRQPRTRIGREAGEVMLSMIAAQSLTAPSRRIPLELIRRASVAPPP
ncbi:LacI family DNA-binding transcriptional regulator [Oceaniglobus indicus]|uniref:LacI family DNA-binding transcriptional regulator n=1 Tax=Oceaniglobus indicus TaxID=2047749 RepID=UPI001F4D45E4|nr:LacI family DNA-binding transcriptional regulator [Oceaniglobus indicus]